MKTHLFLHALCSASLVSCYPIYQESGTPTNELVVGPETAVPPSSNTSGSYPYAEKTSTPGIVISPYEPYNVFDVSGLRPGSLALDTSCDKKFRVPE